MKKDIEDFYNKYWIDIGVFLFLILLVGGGLLFIKTSKQEKGEITIVSEETTSKEEEVKGVVEESSNESESTGLININIADQKRLESLTGVGEKTAEKIIDYRDENGNFTTINDIMKVKGIGEGKFEDMEGSITVE